VIIKMEKFINFRSKPTPLNSANVDTDQIIPKQFLKRIERTGFGQFLFFDWRFHDDGSENPDFVLNMPEYKNSSILLAQDNFGCGSSREHAPWALRDYGFKVIISTSFADIFYNNSFKNGILPIVVDNDLLSKFFKFINDDSNYEMDINLNDQTIKDNLNNEFKFDVDAFRKKCLLEGLDDIALTLEHKKKIDIFEKNYLK
tara:strand:+ start:3781 stop:4383 length:603 start_codon:yes stop_codon:yes gene_type:complete